MLLPAVIALVAAASAATAAAEPIAAAATASDWSNTYDDGTTIKVSSIGSGIVRVKTVPRGAQEDFSSVDLTLPQPQPPPALAVTKTPAGWTLATAELRVHVSSSAATADVARADGTMLSQEHAPPAALPEAQCGVKGGGFIAGGCLRASRSLQGEEEMFGGGVQLYSGPAQRGKKLFMRTNAVVGDAHPGWSHTVAPLFFSSRGYGLLVNTHAYTYFDIGATESGHTVTPPPPGIVCDTKWGDPIGGNTSALVLKCPTGGKISAVTFASYGTPKGDCGHFKTGHCAQDRTAAMKKLCLGKAECSVKVSNDCEACPNGTCTEHCGDPCWGNAEKHLSVSVECKGQPVQPPPPAPPVVPASNLIHVADPVVDLFFFAGPTNHAVLEQFTALTGRMSMPPKWAMGLWYHPQEHSNQTVVLDIVESFKKNDVPLAALTLEPPWQTHAYSCSYVWNPAMFWDPAGFIKTLNAKDVQLTLWEHGYVYNGTAEEGAKCVAEPCPRPTPPCPSGWWEGKGPASPAHPGTGGSGTCNQGCPSDSQARDPTSGRCLCGEQSWGCNDVFHCAKPSAAEGKGTCVDGGAPGTEVSPLFMPLLENDCAADWITWHGLTPDFTLNKTKEIYKEYHTKTFVDIGVAGFKLDECDGNPSTFDPGSGQAIRWFFPDNASFPSGMSGAQMHNIFGASYGELFHSMYADVGKRTFLKARAMYVGSQAHPTTFYSDSYDYPNYLLGVINSGWGGWVWAPETRHATDNSDFARRAQLMLFSGLASMDGWNTGFVPWNSTAVSAESEKMFSELTQERAKLQPFLYVAYQRQGVSGVPVCRAMMVDYDNDTLSYTIDDQYLLGDGLLVAPVVEENATSRSVHFPGDDNWVDYWANTTASHKGGSTATVAAPLTTLPLFQRKGSVVPMIDLDDATVLVLKTHDDGTPHRGTVYDDDGISTNAELHGEYFNMHTETRYESGTTLTVRVEHAAWTPVWTHVRWEVAGLSVERWETLRCGDVDLPRVANDEVVGAVGGWSVVEGKATVVVPMTITAGWEMSCAVVQ